MGKTCFRRPFFYLPIICKMLYMVLNYCIIAFILLDMVFSHEKPKRTDRQNQDCTKGAGDGRRGLPRHAAAHHG